MKKKPMKDTREVFQCNECGEDWIHGGDAACPFCGSTDTGPKDDTPSGVPCPK
jgi:rubrerythrin